VQLKVPGLTNVLCNAEFAECDGLEMTMQPKTVREGGNNTQQIHLAGPVTYGTLTLKRGMTSNLELWNWFRMAAGNSTRGVKAEGVIIMGDNRPVDSEPSQPTRRVRFTLKECLPIKMKAPALNAKTGILAIEEMQIAYGWFTVELVQ
jgi:phage tail-like protein